ncbi:hypothetical protein TraAM80_06562 [Trypanosoma rangeli]|uniref:Uncharacterized protein n=1 Tax=Trypanosoma rangeli TaxID=5698 RepID=A0A3R7K5P1_TRYRA|nr:uncharacterized protein TraAM80_06562 [Trypanosoma rangeli]RNF02137.1 hypothetical protein TraAM80_06562 [Trypanosoma rangeli]|eukprot:RNF02137.1 hypothetical protein TraAM80_06562 [Trypanosoma rangeli]
MNSRSLEDEYDLYAVDRTFVLSLFHGFCTAVPPDARKQLATTEVDAVQYVMILRPRLTSFTHRCNISLRHPAVSMAARLYYNNQRAALQEEGGQSGDCMTGVTSMLGSTTTSRGSVLGRRSSRRASWVGSIEGSTKSITLQQLTRNNWELLASCHDVMLRNSKPRRIALRAIASNEFVNDVICRYWERITVPPGEVELNPRFYFGRSSSSISTGVVSSSLTYATRMTASQYVYLHLRIAGILLPPSSLQAEILDSIILDLRKDATLSQSNAGLLFGRAPELYGNRVNEDTIVDDLVGLEASTSSVYCRGEDTLAQLAEIAGKSKVAPDVNNFSASLTDFPDISFGQFWQSMLELSDNWTSSSHPMEHAAFLMELYCEVFAHEWDDDELDLLKTLRANVESRQQEDLLSIMGDEERSLHMLSEFNHMMWSIGEYSTSGSAYQPNIPIISRRPSPVAGASSDESSTAAGFSRPGTVGKAAGHSQSARSSRSSWKSKEQSGRRGSRLQRDKHTWSFRGSTDLRRRSRKGRDDDNESEVEETGSKRLDWRGNRRRVGHKGKGVDGAELDSVGRDEGLGRVARRRRRKRHGVSGVQEDYEESEELQEEKGSEGSHKVYLSGGRKQYGRNTLEREGEGGKRLSWPGSDVDSASVHSGDLTEPQLQRTSGKKARRRRRRHGSAGGSREADEGEAGIVDADGARRRQRPGGRRDAGEHKQGEGRGSGEVSWSIGSSLVYSQPDSELSPDALARRQHERAKPHRERLRRRKQREEERYSPLVLMTAEISERRDRIVRNLQSKGIIISGDILSDEDVLQLGENSFNEVLLRRLLEGAGYATGDMTDSDFFHILFGDQELPRAAVSAAAQGRVLDVLRAQPQRRPPETAYARHRREQQEKLLREQARAAAIAAAKARRDEHRRAREDAEISGTLSSSLSESVESTGFERVPAARPLPPQRGTGLLPVVHPTEPPGAELFEGFWPPFVRRGTQRPSRGGLPTYRGGLAVDDVLLEVSPHFMKEKPASEALGGELHEHSPARLALFYRDISLYQTIRGRAPLAHPTSILGGTYHQLPSIQLPRHKSRRETREASSSPPPPPPPPRYAPVKLFSLTTKTSFAEALRESLQRYVDDKEYLESIYRSSMK